MSYNDSIQDWLAIIDYKDKEQARWCRENITKIRRKGVATKPNERK